MVNDLLTNRLVRLMQLMCPVLQLQTLLGLLYVKHADN